MKRILKKNQVVLTLLAVMIAVAGYLNYTADHTVGEAQMASGQEAGKNTGLSGELLEISDEDILAENHALSAALQETFDASVEQQLVEIQSVTKTESTPGQESSAQAADTKEAEGELTQKENPSGTQNVGSDTPGTAVLTGGTQILDYVAGVQLSREQTRAKNKESLMEIINNDNLNETQKQEAVQAMLRLTEIAEKETAAETLLSAKGFDNAIVYINDDSVDVVICQTTLTDAQRAQVEDIVKRKAEVTADKIVITLLEDPQ